jgi:hypothetical protein
MKDTTVSELIAEFGHPNKWPRFGYIRLEQDDNDYQLWWHEPVSGWDRCRYELVPWMPVENKPGWITQGKGHPVRIVD